MRGYKYIKFSKSTAKKNPDMIIREYNRLINIKEKEIKTFLEQSFEIPVAVVGIDTEKLNFILQEGTIYKYNGAFNLRTDIEFIVKIYKSIKTQQEHESKIYEELQKIKEEKIKFLTRFSTTNN